MRHRLTLLSGALALAACQAGTPDESAANEVTNEPASRAPLPLAEPPMTRAELLEIVARVASATALGADTVDQQPSLDGRRFEVRIRFGCAGGASVSAAGPFNIRFNEQDRTLRIRAVPDILGQDPWIAGLAGEAVEAVEGFWMYRPWLLADGCPVVPAPATAPTADQAEPRSTPEPAAAPPSLRHRVGIAQFFTESDARTARRRGRAYEATKVLEADERPSLQGYNLVLSGRLRQIGNSRVVACRPLGRDAPPECLVSAQFDRVRIERPDTAAVLAEWTG